jgi:hypothetical protein
MKKPIKLITLENLLNQVRIQEEKEKAIAKANVIPVKFK